MIYILLPAYNEEKNLKIIFKKIKKSFKDKKKIRVVLIDDCSITIQKNSIKRIILKSFIKNIIKIKG